MKRKILAALMIFILLLSGCSNKEAEPQTKEPSITKINSKDSVTKEYCNQILDKIKLDFEKIGYKNEKILDIFYLKPKDCNSDRKERILLIVTANAKGMLNNNDLLIKNAYTISDPVIKEGIAEGEIDCVFEGTYLKETGERTDFSPRFESYESFLEEYIYKEFNAETVKLE